MICRRCGTSNPDEAVYCAGCGRPLLRRLDSGRKSFLPFLLAAGGAAVLLILYLLYRHVTPAPQTGPERGAESADARASQPAPPADSALRPTFGEVIVRGAADREIYRTAAAVFGGEWMALPVSALLGGEDLSFQADGSAAVRVSAGTWTPADPVVFWKVETGYRPAALNLAEWRPALPLDWFPSRSTEPPLRLEAAASRKAGSFASFSAPPGIQFPGVLLQEGALVGWTFGAPFNQAYLWAAAPATGPPAAIRAEQFFSAISSESREGYFSRLLDSAPGATPSVELEAWARGFRLAPLLAPEDLPPELRQSAVVARMDAIVSELIRNGLGNEVVRILDDSLIRQSADPVLARDAVLALAGSQDYNRTIRRLEAIEHDVFAVRGQTPGELSELKRQLYKDWLRKIIEKGDYYSGAVAFEEARRAFPDDPEIRLLGVEIAIADNEPDRARELLGTGGYPPELKERVDQLGAQLNENQDEAEDIIIRFDPAKGYIPVEAVINGSFTQKFIIDTGASFVIIPASTAVALKIKVDDAIPARAVATANGMALAYEVTLESIQLDKFKVDNVTALVMEMRANPDYGLLGLNFFDAFSAEIDRQNGVLRLRKKQG